MVLIPAIWRGNLTEGFLRYEFVGLILILEGAYTWRGLFLEFYAMIVCDWECRKVSIVHIN